MSEVKVNKISPRSGTNVQLGDSGDTITVPSGATLDASNATTTLPANVVTTTGTQTLTNKTIDASQLTGTITPSDNTVTPAKLAYNYNQYRNIIINGDMSIAQRGTSESGITSVGYYTADRIKIVNEITSAVFTVSQSTDVPSGQGFSKSMKWDCTTANASPSTGFLTVQQIIEGQNLQYLKKGTANAESTTLSFWIKSNKTGTYVCELYDSDNNRTISQAYTISSASTWEKKTLTFAGDTTGAFNNDNDASLYVSIFLGAGTEYTSGSLQTSWGTRSNTKRAVGQVNLADSTSNELYITGIQLEAGTTASDFEFLPYDVNLDRCERYYQTIIKSQDEAICNAASFGTSTAYGVYVFRKEMRSSPSLDQTTGTSYYQYTNAGDGDNFDSFTMSLTSTRSARFNNADSISVTTGQAGWFKQQNSNAEMKLDAEL